jgi:cytoskeletal protein CcmA (bactofilin family)
MKKILSLFLFIAFFSSSSFVFAENASFTSSNKEDVYQYGSEKIKENIIGDLMSFGYSIGTEKTVGQDLFSAGHSVQIFGDVGDDAHVLGYFIVVGESIHDNLMAIGGEMIIRSEAEIGGDVSFFGETIEINGPIKGDVKIFANRVILNASIGGNANITAGKLTFGEHGTIFGDLELTSPYQVQEKNIKGKLTFYPVEREEETYFERRLYALSSATSLISLFSVFTVGGLFLFFFRKYFVSLSVVSRKSFFSSVGVGFLMLICLPMLAFFFFLSVLGISLGILTILFFSIFIIFACIIDGLILGTFFFPVTEKSSFWQIYGSFCLGTFLLFLFPLIPYFGYPLLFIFFLGTLGSIGRVLKEKLVFQMG